MPASKKDEKIITPILEKVDRKENALDKRFRWMDHDYNHGWRLDAFKPLPSEGVREQDVYTSNYPKVLNTRTSGAIASAERIIRVEDDADNKEFRDQNNAYERLAIGMLENGDERLVNSVKPSLQGGAAWMAIVRGAWIATRAVLIKDEEGETVEDIWPIDQRGLVYEPGTGEPLWAAIVTERSKQSIRDDYPGFKFDGEQDNIDDNDELARVVDYYWTQKDKSTKDDDGEEIPGRKRRMNAVIINRQFAKKPTDTFAVNFPIVIRLIGNNPGVSNFTIKETDGQREVNGIEDVGDSMYTALREVNPNINRLRSYRQALTHKAVQAIAKVTSKDGTKELDQDIYEDGAEIQLSTDNNEDVELMEVAQLTSDASQLEAAYLSDQSNAGISQQRLGNFPGPVSGSALRIVGQSDNDVIAPFLEAVQSLIKGVIDNLGKQFETGRYKPIKVRGKVSGGVPFNTTIEPEDIKGHGVLSVELMPSQPEDEIERWQTAHVAATVDPNTGIALVSPEYAATKIAKVQDWDLELRRQFAMRARTSNEESIWLTQLHAAQESQEDENVIAFIEENLQRAQDKQAMEDFAREQAFIQAFSQNPVQTSADGINGAAPSNGAGGQQQSNPATLNVDPRLIPNSGRAGVDSTPSPDAGFNTTAPRGGDNGLEPNV